MGGPEGIAAILYHPAMRMPALASLVLVFLVALAAPARGEELTVGIKEAPPFVMLGEGKAPRGFSIDLIREIAARLDPAREVRFVVHPDLTTHLDAVAKGEVDMGIAATTVTAEREAKMDFSQGFYPDSLDIVVSDRGSSTSLWAAVRDSDVPGVLLGLAIFVLITAHIVWLVERGRGGLDKGYLSGVGEGVWWTIVTMSTVGYGDIVPKTGIGRLLGVIVIFAGIVVFGVAVASLTAAATAQKLETSVRDIGDVRGKRVVAIDGSIAQRELEQRGFKPDAVPNTAAGLEAVRSGSAVAFVHDRSQLLYALSREGDGLVLVGRAAVPQDYAVAFPLGSPLRKQVNIALQRLKEGEDAPYAEIKRRWFPED